MIPSDAIRTMVGQDITGTERLHGGDLSDVYRLHLIDGSSVVVKTGPVVDREARMLNTLAENGAPVPDVLAARGGVLILEDLGDGRETKAAWRGLGEALRRLHDMPHPGFGWPEPYAFGQVEIDNTSAPTWPQFWAERRLITFAPHLPPDLSIRLEQLSARLSDHLPDSPTAGLLHGDLWRGNIHFSMDQAWLIDPACYFGHGEVDLAMLYMFGAPNPAFFDGYGTPEPGWAERRAIYQLWPALVHLRLFGDSYRSMVSKLLQQCCA